MVQQATFAQKKAKMILKNGTVISGKLQSSAVLADIYVEGSMITAVVEKGKTGPTGYEGAIVTDLQGKFILPGLIDTHVHLATQMNNPIGVLNKRISSDLKRVLYGGITTVRDMGGDARLLALYQRSANLDQIPAPDIYYAAFLAGPDYMKLAGKEEEMGKQHQEFGWRQTIAENANAHDVITMAKGSGATGIKIYSDISAPMVMKLAKEARLQHMEIWSHATVIPALPSDAVNAGVKVISHAHDIPWEQTGHKKKIKNDGEGYSRLKKNFQQLKPLIDLMKKKDVILDATIYLSSMNKGYDVNAFYITKRMHEAGVKVSAGTDWMIPEDSDLPNIHHEMALLVDSCGFSPLEAIHAATHIGAEAIGLADRGEISPGKKADLLVLNANPLENIKATQAIFFVVKNGKMIEKEK